MIENSSLPRYNGGSMNDALSPQIAEKISLPKEPFSRQYQFSRHWARPSGSTAFALQFGSESSSTPTGR
jgi:hypothetical protein